jgi:phosphatidylglycerophosphate synthase
MSNNNSGRKVNSSIENPIDDVMIKISEALSPWFKKLNYTPNGLTTISLIFALASLYHLYHHQGYQFAIYFVLSYLFDCMDGNYARKYKMVSDGGDKYDHYKDLLVVIAIICIIFMRYNTTEFPILLVIVSVLIVLAAMSVQCHEKITDKGTSDTLQILDIVAPSKETCSNYIQYLRFFGPGTLVFVVAAAVIYINSFEVSTTETMQTLSGNTSYNNAYTSRDVLDISRPFNGFGATTTNPFL